MSQSAIPRPYRTEFDPVLVEEAVLLRITGDLEERSFYRSRDPIYNWADPDQREKLFRKFHAEWFVRLRLGSPVRDSLEEQPLLTRHTRRCCVFSARSAQEEGADLHGLRDSRAQGPGADKVILIRLRPTRLLDGPGLRNWIRHELMHVADILDPQFGYEPTLPDSEAGPAFTNLLRDRYRVLWDTWIDGRLARRNWLPDGVREQRLQEFSAIFSTFGPEVEAKFQEIFDSTLQTHAGLIALALHPGLRIDSIATGQSRPQPCPLCRFPTYQLLDAVVELPEDVRGQICEDFPNWKPEQGLCRQCADLYCAREISRSAEAALPGIR